MHRTQLARRGKILRASVRVNCPLPHCCNDIFFLFLFPFFSFGKNRCFVRFPVTHKLLVSVMEFCKVKQTVTDMSYFFKDVLAEMWVI